MNPPQLKDPSLKSVLAAWTFSLWIGLVSLAYLYHMLIPFLRP